MISDVVKGLAFYSRFATSFTTIGYGARRLAWGDEDFDLSDQVWLVTGGTGGIGKAVILTALEHGAQAIAVARNSDKLAQLAGDAGEHAERLSLEQVDLSLQQDLHRLVQKLTASGTRIDVLVNNVGILNNDYSQTPEGHETSYATNLLNQHLLTEGLIGGDALSPGARVINVSSGGLYNVPRNTAYLDQAEEGYNGVAAYASHKRAQLALADYYRQKYRDRDLRFYAMHPGWVDTAGVQTSLPIFRAVSQHVLRDGPQGADTIIWLGATTPPEVTDQIWFDRKPRPAHAFKGTRKAYASVEDIAAHLDKDIEAFKERSAD